MGMPMRRGRGVKIKTNIDRTTQSKISTEMPPPCKECGDATGRRAIDGRKDGLCTNCASHKDTQAGKRRK